MIQCPYCQKNVPDDSLYCDLCGKKLNFCPKCRKPGAGRVCGSCGTPMVGGAGNGAPPNLFAPKEAVRKENPFVAAKPATPPNPFVRKEADRQENPTTSAQVLKLQCSALAEAFAVQSGARFGRDIHPMNDRKAFDTISSNHGIFARSGRGWTFKDVGSTNGTALNGRRIQTNREEQLSDGDTLQMGEIIFKVILK